VKANWIVALIVGVIFTALLFAGGVIPYRSETLAQRAVQGTDSPQLAAACSGASDTRSAIAVANNAGHFQVSAAACHVNSNIVISSSVTFQPGAYFLPASGVLITFTGTINAQKAKICDLSLGGHCDFRKAQVSTTYPEWVGVIAGDDSFDSAKARTNGPLITDLIIYGSYRLEFSSPGIYSTTCHVMTVPHEYYGLGQSFAAGSATVVNGIVGSGCPATDHAHLGSDISATAKYVFQPAPGGRINNNASQFNHISIGVSDPATTIPVGVLWSTTAINNWAVNFNDCAMTGLYGLHFAWANGNSVHACTLAGTAGAIAETIPVRGGVTVQKVWVSDTALLQTGSPRSGSCVYQRNPYDSQALWQTNFADVTIENCYDGVTLAAMPALMTGIHMERILHRMAVETGRSLWTFPTAAGGNSVNTLLTQLSCLSSAQTSGSTFYIAAGTCEVMVSSGKGAPNNAQYAGQGSLWLRQDGGPGTSLYVKESNGTSNTGWAGK
jgi:hypothetical protein